MSYTQFNGWNIVPMPSAPQPRQIVMTQSNAVGKTVSPFTQQAQIQAWPGGDWWEVEVQLPGLKPTQVGAWRAWLAALRGITNVFQIGDPWGTTPQGTPLGTPVCQTSSSLNQDMAATIYTQGWTANKANLLLPGDYLQIGYRFHVVAGMTPVNSDASGNASFEIWPSLRESASGVSIVTSNCKGLFRLQDNRGQISKSANSLFGFSFRAIEAR